jgi:hypothetical protein
MGTGRFDSTSWSSYATSTYGTTDRAKMRSTSAAKTFTAKGIDPTTDPSKVKDTVTGNRESRDSADNPRSTPVMLFSDVTGSMGHLAQEVLTGLETVCTELYDRKPVTDPHIMTGAIGDAFYDSAPLQATQFEADIRIATETRKLYLEGGGGGNFGESYAMVWLFAALLTSTDAWEKRGEKGFLFTVGDEPLLGSTNLMGKPYGRGHADGIAVTKDQAKRFLGLDIERDLSAEECYDMAAQKWEIFHVCVNRSYEAGVKDSFGKVLGDRLLWLQDTAVLPELVVSAIQVAKGAAVADVAKTWSGTTAVAIADALKGDLVAAGGGSGGVARL